MTPLVNMTTERKLQRILCVTWCGHKTRSVKEFSVILKLLKFILVTQLPQKDVCTFLAQVRKRKRDWCFTITQSVLSIWWLERPFIIWLSCAWLDYWSTICDAQGSFCHLVYILLQPPAKKSLKAINNLINKLSWWNVLFALRPVRHCCRRSSDTECGR